MNELNDPSIVVNYAAALDRIASELAGEHLEGLRTLAEGGRDALVGAGDTEYADALIEKLAGWWGWGWRIRHCSRNQGRDVYEPALPEPIGELPPGRREAFEAQRREARTTYDRTAAVYGTEAVVLSVDGYERVADVWGLPTADGQVRLFADAFCTIEHACQMMRQLLDEGEDGDEA